MGELAPGCEVKEGMMGRQRKHDDLKVTLTHHGANGRVLRQVETTGVNMARVAHMSDEEFARLMDRVEAAKARRETQ